MLRRKIAFENKTKDAWEEKLDNVLIPFLRYRIVFFLIPSTGTSMPTSKSLTANLPILHVSAMIAVLKLSFLRDGM